MRGERAATIDQRPRQRWFPWMTAALLFACNRSDPASTQDDAAAGQVIDLGSAGDGEADAALRPVGGRLLFPGRFTLGPVTTDDSILAWGTDGIYALSLTGGGKTLLARSADWTKAIGVRLFSWHGSPDDIAATTTWSAATGSMVLADKSIRSLAQASADGQWVFFSDGAMRLSLTSTALSAELLITGADGSHRTSLGRTIASDTCFPAAAFLGEDLLVLHCPAAGDAGATTRELLFASAAAGTRATLRTGLAQSPFWVDQARRQVLVADEVGTGWLLSVDGAAPVKIGPDVRDGLILNDPPRVVYQTSRGTLESKETAMGSAATVLIGQGVNQLQLPRQILETRKAGTYNLRVPGVSPDGRHLLYSSMTSSRSFGVFSDLYIASTTEVASPVLLVDEATARLISGPFSDDGRTVLLHRDCEGPEGFLSVVCRLFTSKTDGSGQLERAKNCEASFPGRGDVFAYNANYHPFGEGDGKADIFVANYSGSMNTLVARDAEAWFWVNPNKDKLVYSQMDGEEPGVYVFDLP